MYKLGQVAGKRQITEKHSKHKWQIPNKIVLVYKIGQKSFRSEIRRVLGQTKKKITREIVLLHISDN